MNISSYKKKKSLKWPARMLDLRGRQRSDVEGDGSTPVKKGHLHKFQADKIHFFAYGDRIRGAD